MDHSDKDLQELVATGKTQGYLTYDQVNDYLPDEAVNPEKLDNLLIALEELGIELVNEAPDRWPRRRRAGSASVDRRPTTPRAEDRSCSPLPARELPKLSDDPVRMYLTQMAEIPLLTRERRNLAGQEDRSHPQAIPPHGAGLQLRPAGHDSTRSTKCIDGALPFDRTIKVSLTERLTKEQILARMPHNLPTLEHLLKQNRGDFRQLISRKRRRRDEGRLPASGSVAPPQDADAGRRAQPADAPRAAADAAARRNVAADGRHSARSADRLGDDARPRTSGPTCATSCAT